MKYALIGCGRISPNHLAAAKTNGLEIVAVCDLVPERMEQRLKEAALSKNEVHTYTDYRELLKKEKPDLVAIATESGKHAEIALECIEAGCNVIIEKPIALSVADARQMIAAAEKREVKLCVCHQNRFNKAVQKIHNAVTSGRFGRMLYGTAQIRWNRNESYYKQAAWRGTWEQDGGALMNQCIHNIDLLCWMMGGEVEEVMAYTDRLNHPYIQAEDLGLALVRFQNGGYGVIEGSTCIYPSNMEETLSLFGETGSVKAGGKSVNAIEYWKFADETQPMEDIIAEFSESPPNIYGFGHAPLYADVIEAVRENRPVYVDGWAGLRALEVVLGIYRSASSGKAVRFPLESCAATDFCGRFDGREVPAFGL